MIVTADDSAGAGESLRIRTCGCPLFRSFSTILGPSESLSTTTGKLTGHGVRKRTTGCSAPKAQATATRRSEAFIAISVLRFSVEAPCRDEGLRSESAALDERSAL